MHTIFGLHQHVFNKKLTREEMMEAVGQIFTKELEVDKPLTKNVFSQTDIMVEFESYITFNLHQPGYDQKIIANAVVRYYVPQNKIKDQEYLTGLTVTPDHYEIICQCPRFLQPDAYL